jgi:MFS family permease
VTSPLRDRNFRLLWTAGLISDTGDWLLLVSLPILVYQLTGSAFGTAVAFLVELAPGILLSPLAGYVADRWDRRRTLVVLSLVQAVALLPLLALRDAGDLWLGYVVITLQAALFTLFEPTKNALLPTLVHKDRLVAANSLVGLNQNVGRLVGAPIGGLLLAVGSLTTIVAVDVVSFAAAALLIARLRRAVPVDSGSEAVDDATATASDADTTTGPARASAHRTVRSGLAVAGLAGAAQGLFAVLFVIFVARVLHGGEAETGLLRGVQAIGAIAGGVVLGTLRKALPPAALTAWACAAFGVLALLTWNGPRLTTAPAGYVVLFILVGVPGVALLTGLMSTLQAATPDGRRGRVFAAFGAMFSAGQVVGMLAAGLLTDRFGVVPLLNAQGTLYLLAGAVAARWMTQRRPANRVGLGRRAERSRQSSHHSS